MPGVVTGLLKAYLNGSGSAPTAMLPLDIIPSTVRTALPVAEASSAVLLLKLYRYTSSCNKTFPVPLARSSKSLSDEVVVIKLSSNRISPNCVPLLKSILPFTVRLPVTSTSLETDSVLETVVKPTTVVFFNVVSSVTSKLLSMTVSLMNTMS